MNYILPSFFGQYVQKTVYRKFCFKIITLKRLSFLSLQYDNHFPVNNIDSYIMVCPFLKGSFIMTLLL